MSRLPSAETQLKNIAALTGKVNGKGADGSRTPPQITAMVSPWDGDLAPPTGLGFKWYRKARLIRRDPTVRMMRRLFMAPLIASEWTIKTEDWTPPGAKELLEDTVIKKLKLKLQRSAYCGMIDYGWQSYERWYEPRPDGFIEPKIKSLLQDLTTILVDADSGAFIGLKQAPALSHGNLIGFKYLVGPEALLFSQDVEGTNWYGEPTLKAIESTYDETEVLDKASRKYDARIAGSHWVIYYPLGTSKFDGVDTSNYEIARNLLKNAESMSGIAVPRSVVEFIDSANAEMGDKEGAQWKIELLTDSGAGQTAFLEKAKYNDVKKVRAFGFPERAVLEGQFGTKAEAVAHGDLAVTNLEIENKLFCKQVDEQIIDDMLAFNFGEEFRGCACVEPAPLTDADKAYLQKIYETLLANPNMALDEVSVIDRDAVREKVGVPALPYDPMVAEQVAMQPEMDMLQQQFASALPAMSWNEEDHPRAPGGTKEGGQFAEKMFKKHEASIKAAKTHADLKKISSAMLGDESINNEQLRKVATAMLDEKKEALNAEQFDREFEESASNDDVVMRSFMTGFEDGYKQKKVNFKKHDKHYGRGYSRGSEKRGDDESEGIKPVFDDGDAYDAWKDYNQ